MFQTFDPPGESAAGTERVKKLRALMRDLGLDVFLVPRADEHQGEYVAKRSERLAWLTGFTGSAGWAAIGRRAAALFVDGRYTVQAKAQVDTDVFQIKLIPTEKLSDWLITSEAKGAVVGFDPWLHTVADIERLTEALTPKGIVLKAVSRNPIDRIWGKDRPAAPAGPVIPHPERYAGQSAAEKIAAVQKRLVADGQDAVVLTLPDSIAWLLNIRGTDVPHTPLVLAFALVPATGKPELFIAAERLGGEGKAHITKIAKVVDPSMLPARLSALKEAGKRVRLDADTAAWWFARRLGGPKAIPRGSDPVTAMKARKNEVEIAGCRSAHVRDGAAMVRFLAWLDHEAPSGKIDEITAVKKLEACRAETQALREISFDTISGSGPNGAIVHYRVTTKSNRRLQPGELFLIDSGGQYQDGTTDITRTVAIGAPTAEMRERFTLVLKGHIAIATARFPRGTRGIDLDPLARKALWERGLDYDHGTGHGVGSYLSVHEGPASISRRGMVALEPGMILSNEPGYYKEGAYGIRIENLVLVTGPHLPPGGDREIMSFETLTLAPIDRRLVVTDLLTEDERRWLDSYHARVRSVLGPEVSGTDRQWLDAATAPL
jgi:Xaa-Pro aminopeptidase